LPAFLIPALKYWKLISIGLLCLALAVQSVRLGHAKNETERVKVNLSECRQGRIDDRNAYQDAQRKARELNEAEVKRISDEQDRISNNVESDLRARLERLRDELRKGTPAPQGIAGRPKAGADGKAAGGVANPPALCLSAEELLRAAEDEERHDQLITWVEKLMGVAR
jgi:hypothetical protein